MKYNSAQELMYRTAQSRHAQILRIRLVLLKHSAKLRGLIYVKRTLSGKPRRIILGRMDVQINIRLHF